jgi:hypothetical protein
VKNVGADVGRSPYFGHAAATLAAFLTSPEADNITGQALDVSAE